MFRPVRWITFLAASAAFWPVVCTASEPEVRVAQAVVGGGLNRMVVEAIQRMPTGGMYATSKKSFDGLTRAVTVGGRGLQISPEAAQPSFCSGATYLIFLQVVERLQREGALSLDAATLASLQVAGQRDGQGIWGRWNANGPGTARLFNELQLGRNFTDYAEARPGDFMKIFWTEEIGKKERGHSVVYLNKIGAGASEYVQFWSSNVAREKGDLSGYGVKLVPRSKIKRCIFSRLERPGNISRARALPGTDAFLASMLTRSSDIGEVRRMCGF